MNEGMALCLNYTNKVFFFLPGMCDGTHNCKYTLGLKQGDPKFKTSWSCIVSWRIAWAMK